MPPIPLRVVVYGDAEVEASLTRGQEALMDMKPVLEVVADDMMRVVRATISSQGRRYGGSWHALNPQYLARKIKKGLDPRIMVATGKLLSAYGMRGSPFQRLRIFPDRLELGSNLDYPRFHETGTSKMSQRAFLEFYPQDRKRWADMVTSYVHEAMKLP
jgi:phage gpG-like protein